MTDVVRPTRAEISLDAIAHNVELLRKLAAPADLLAVVKADGYGHGAVAVAVAALEAGATWLGVALVEEGEQLRAAGITAPVLVLAEPPPAAVPRLLDAGLTPAVYSDDLARALTIEALERGGRVRVHVKADTGMSRVGVPEADWARFLRESVDRDALEVEAIWTHLACADEPDHASVAEQLARFDTMLDVARAAGIEPSVTHAANSAGTIAVPGARRDLVRCGIAMYGLSPAPSLDGVADLRPALRLVTEVAFAKRIAAGTAVSYGHTWRAPADGWLATVPVGYADGVPRALSNRGHVLVGGARRPIAGTVCMDQLTVWCADDEVGAGDEVVLLGTQGDASVRAEEWAELLGTITYEVATGIGARVPRVYVDREVAG